MKVAVESLEPVGANLRRPECVLCTASGDVFAAHLGNGIVRINPAGEQRTIGDTAQVDGQAFIPNGLALLPDGSFVVANMGEGGGLWRLEPGGALRPHLREVDGEVLTATNFVLLDAAGRLWLTVTTRRWPISQAFFPRGGPEVADGYIAVIDRNGARIVADGLAFTNELRLDGAGRYLYAVETFARRITRFRVGPDATLSGREVFTSFGHGTFPDGIAFDEQGHLWTASIVSNRLIRIAPDGAQEIVIEDSDAGHVDKIEQALADGTLRREDIGTPAGKVLRNVSSLAFGGPDRKTVYLGSLSGDRLLRFRSLVAGRKPAHWDFHAGG